MMLPHVCVIEDGEKMLEYDTKSEGKMVVSAVKLMQFIDLYNFYPVKVNKMRYRNDSHELTHTIVQHDS